MIQESSVRSLPKILIVDDNEYDRLIYTEYLREINYTFFELEDGDQIFEFLSKQLPDVIILDWQMRRLNGIEVLRFDKKTISINTYQ